MKILVVGAGAVGGYFGARLVEAGRDVAFLVRPGRAKQIAATGGLVVLSPLGDFTIPNPSLVQADGIKQHYDLIILTCKSTTLESCINDIGPAVGPETMILPVLNGMSHIDRLIEVFGEKAVLGGRARIFATLDDEGRIIHQAPIHGIEFGELAGGETPRIRAVAEQLCHAGFDANLRTDIVDALWEKWVMIAATAGITALMRASIGDINRAGGENFIRGLFKETMAIAALNGHPVTERFAAGHMKAITDRTSLQRASLAKDIDKNLPIEGEHIFGELLKRAPEDKRKDFPLLSLVLLHVRAYEERRQRESNTAK